MAIQVICSCGKSLTARDEHAGKRAKCPSCGSVITIEEAAVLEEASATGGTVQSDHARYRARDQPERVFEFLDQGDGRW